MESIPDTLITTYLEMIDPAQFRPAYSAAQNVTIMQMEEPDIAFYRFLYSEVGEAWRWRDRLLLPEDELRAILADDATDVHVLYEDGVPAGYIELFQEGEDTEIAYFGLRPGFMGRGLGKHLLSYGVERAWEAGAKRVWVHTCNLDSPHALPTYQARGFEVYDVRKQPMPERYC